jgi:hypothetical protein
LIEQEAVFGKPCFGVTFLAASLAFLLVVVGGFCAQVCWWVGFWVLFYVWFGFCGLFGCSSSWVSIFPNGRPDQKPLVTEAKSRPNFFVKMPSALYFKHYKLTKLLGDYYIG